MAESDPLRALHTTVRCYLYTLVAVADCLGVACPPVGGPYRHRLTRLKTRLAFDTNPEAIEESCQVTTTTLKEYGDKASAYLERHGLELRRALAELEEIVRRLTERQDFYSARLRQLVGQMESASYPTDPEQLPAFVAEQALGLLSCVDSMSHEGQSLLARMQDEMASVEQRLADAETTDRATGLMNRREMERSIEARKTAGTPVVLLLFEFSGNLADEVIAQVAVRLGSQFRHNDIISRWNYNEFLVLFAGTPETAQNRASQIAPWVSGRYPLDNGEITEVKVEARLVETTEAVPL